MRLVRCYTLYRLSNLLLYAGSLLRSNCFSKVNREGYTTVLGMCETWSLMLREEHRLRVFENTVLRRRVGPKRDEVTGGWRKLHNKQLHNLYSSRLSTRNL
jgi:hypothetical protein